jgi:hypothetical protein
MAAEWLSPPVAADPQSMAPPSNGLDLWNWNSEGVNPPPGVARPPAGLSMNKSPPAVLRKAPPPGMAKAPPNFPSNVHIPVAAPLAGGVPITITRTLEDSVKAAEKRICDSLNSKVGELLNCVRDLEKQVAALRVDVAVNKHKANTKDQGTDPWNHEPKGMWHDYSYTSTADSTGGQGDYAQDPWKHWPKADVRDHSATTTAHPIGDRGEDEHGPWEHWPKADWY